MNCDNCKFIFWWRYAKDGSQNNQLPRLQTEGGIKMTCPNCNQRLWNEVELLFLRKEDQEEFKGLAETTFRSGGEMNYNKLPFEVFKIIEGGLNGDRDKVKAYAELLASKCENEIDKRIIESKLSGIPKTQIVTLD